MEEAWRTLAQEQEHLDTKDGQQKAAQARRLIL
jgi:hypothetical protein